jgi:predicted hydrolase (HD superfamily)
MGGILVETAQFASRQRRQITAEISQQLPKNLFRNVRPNQILVSHCLFNCSAAFSPLNQERPNFNINCS